MQGPRSWLLGVTATSPTSLLLPGIWGWMVSGPGTVEKPGPAKKGGNLPGSYGEAVLSGPGGPPEMRTGKGNSLSWNASGQGTLIAEADLDNLWDISCDVSCQALGLPGGSRGTVPKFQEQKSSPKSKFWGGISGGRPRGYPGGHPGAKTSVKPSKSCKNKHFGADIHDPKARTSMTAGRFKKISVRKTVPPGPFWTHFPTVSKKTKTVSKTRKL